MWSKDPPTNHPSHINLTTPYGGSFGDAPGVKKSEMISNCTCKWHHCSNMVSGFRKVHHEKWPWIRASCESMSTCKKKNPPIARFGNFEFNITTQTTQFCKGRGDLQTSNQHELRFFWGSMHVAWTCHTQRAYLQNLSGCAKKNGARFRLLKHNQNGFLFWREPAHAKCAATDRFFQPKLENSVGQYCFAWFLISSKTHMKKIRVIFAMQWIC